MPTYIKLLKDTICGKKGSTILATNALAATLIKNKIGKIINDPEPPVPEDDTKVKTII
jgi:hypothetical protein